MDHLKNLDPDTRCQALVGMFIQSWSVMDERLNNAIRKALKLGDMEGRIVCANIKLRDKIHILKTIVSITYTITLEKKAEFKKTLTHIANDAAIRNMMAHDVFCPDGARTGVKFLSVKAKGTFAIPDIEWSLNDFKGAFIKVGKYTDVVDEITKELERAPTLKAIIDALMKQPTPPSEYTERLGLLGSLFHPAPIDPNSDPASSETDAQTSQEPQAKAGD